MVSNGTFISDVYPKLSDIDYSIITAVFLLSSAVGLYFGVLSDKATTTKDFLSANYKSNSVLVAISLAMSQLTPLVITLAPVEIYSFGWHAVLSIPAIIFAMLAVNYLLLPVLYTNGFDNCYTYLAYRFRPLARNINIVAFISNYVVLLPLVLYIPSAILSDATGISIHIINVIVCYICVAYTMQGGLRAILWTNCFQFLLCFTALLAIAVAGIYHIGGVDKVWHAALVGKRLHLPDFTVDVMTRSTFWNITINGFILWLSQIGFSQNNIQRITSLPTIESARRSISIFTTLIIITMAVIYFIGAIIYAHYRDCDPVLAHAIQNHDTLILHFVYTITGHINGIYGIFISCLFCASLCSVASAMHTMAGIIYFDIIRSHKFLTHNNVRANYALRVIILVIGTYCALSSLLVQRFYATFKTLNAIANMTMGAKVGVFTVGLFYPFVNIQGLLSGTLLSMFIVCLIITNAQYQTAGHRTLPFSIDGCINNSTNNSTLVSSVLSTIEDDNEFTFHRISPHWYTLIGVLVMWTTAVIIAYLTGGRDLRDFNFQLLAPIARKWLPKKYQHTKLKVINVPTDAEQDDY